jgi:hypothetical protein
MKIALAALLALTPVSTLASPVYIESDHLYAQSNRDFNDSQAGYSHQRKCFKTEYKEEYVPGTEDNPGYVKSWKDTVEVPCEDPNIGWHGPRRPTPRPYYRRHVTVYEDTNDCSDGKMAGLLLGGGAGAALSRGDGRWWAIPLGAVIGSHIGCDIDGG